MARWITINWSGKFRFHGRPHYRNFKASAENELKAKQMIVDYISSMASAGFILEGEAEENCPYGDSE